MNRYDRQTSISTLRKCLGVMVMLLSLSACTSHHYSDLDKYIEDVKRKTKGRIEPLPEVKTYESYTYQALEGFPLDSLKFVGTIEKDGTTWGLITAPDKAIYRVQVGNHMGRNYGEIMSLNESTILLKEVIPNGSGGWVEREASLALSQ